MTFADAVAQLTDGKAAKRASWGGYAYKTVASGTTDGSYTLTYKNRSGTTYAYAYNGTTGAWTAPETTVPFDAEIQAAMVADDWTVGTTTSYEAARAGSGTW